VKEGFYSFYSIFNLLSFNYRSPDPKLAGQLCKQSLLEGVGGPGKEDRIYHRKFKNLIRNYIDHTHSIKRTNIRGIIKAAIGTNLFYNLS